MAVVAMLYPCQRQLVRSVFCEVTEFRNNLGCMLQGHTSRKLSQMLYAMQRVIERRKRDYFVCEHKHGQHLAIRFYWMNITVGMYTKLMECQQDVNSYLVICRCSTNLCQTTVVAAGFRNQSYSALFISLQIAPTAPMKYLDHVHDKHINTVHDKFSPCPVRCDINQSTGIAFSCPHRLVAITIYVMPISQKATMHRENPQCSLSYERIPS